ncbi:MAG: HD domain-containing protein [Parabacteroides sp.]
MERTSFIQSVAAIYPWIKRVEREAFAIHERVNQHYDGVLPYGFHLKLTASYVSKFGYLVARDEADIPLLYVAAYLHDCIEDARMTYRDVAKWMRMFDEKSPELSEPVREMLEQQVPEIVYALTNEKGRTRDERADARYYEGIRTTRFASFVKMCDRLANIRYSTLFFFANRMLEVYRKEYPNFIRSISEGAVTPVPEPMKQEMESLLLDDNYIISEQTLND